jgi:exodeoxyribonuclease V gamma subunit
VALGHVLPVHVFVQSPQQPEGALEHPLWAAWGRHGREYLQLLQRLPKPSAAQWTWVARSATATHTPSLLQQLQDELSDPPRASGSAAARSTIDPADRSLAFHIAHSPQREVEILHDQLLAAFQQDPELQPRQVMVMVPDIHTYAPHIQAVFGQIERDDPRYLPFAINDQDRSQTQTIVLALDRLLQLDRSRLTVSQVLDWLEVPAFRAAAGLTEMDLPILERWIQDSGIRWGFDADHRQQHGLPPGAAQNTWEFGLRRMLLGYAAGEGPAWNDIQPYARVAGLEAAAAGRLHLLWQRLHRWSLQLQQPISPTAWQSELAELLTTFFLPQSPSEQAQVAQLESALETWCQHCAEASFHTPLPVAVVREHWLAALRQPHFSQKFLGGAINFATLMPMRAIPFKRICLLGMNDGDFPRQQPTNEFDLMSQRGLYRSGDRSRGDDDRYLFLEAILSARQSLYISWVGSSIRDNSPRPPSVLVGQLRDYVSNRWATASGSDGASESAAWLTQLTTPHPLQPFSRDYFRGDPRLFTFSDQWRDVHRGSPPDAQTSRSAMVAWQATEPLGLADLSDFLRSPVDAFFHRVLQVRFGSTESSEVDREPFAVAGLERWSVTSEILGPIATQLRLNPQVDLEQLLQEHLTRVRGAGHFLLPPFARWVQDGLSDDLRRQLQTYHELLTNGQPLAALPFSLSVMLDQDQESLTVSDLLDRVWEDSRQPGHYAQWVLLPNDLRAGKKFNFVQVARLWPYHLALSTLVGEAGATVIIHTGQPPLHLPCLPVAQAEGYWRQLLQMFHQGMQQPLPVACQTAFGSLYDDQADRPSQSTLAEFYYNGGDHVTGDVMRSPLLARCWPTFANLVDAAAEPNFDSCVARLYQPLFQFLQRHVPSLATETADE